MREALFYEKLPGKKVKCTLCPNFCELGEGKTGICRVRRNEGGKLQSLVYGRVCSYNIDPVEKKPLFHFAPGSQALSFATVGCNLRCDFCQNHDVSMIEKVFGTRMEPEDVVNMAVKDRIPGIAYTYTEPTVFYEFALDIMKLARKAGLYNIWISNGYTNPEPIKKAARYMDAINIDIKGDPEFYREVCGVPDSGYIYKALKAYKKAGVWIEVTNLLIPGHNDKPAQIKSLAEWVKKNLGKGTPLHFSRFRPYYRMPDLKPTPVKTLEKAHEVAKSVGMDWVYTGNVPGNEYESSYCPKCGTVLIERAGFELISYTDKCRCGAKIPIAGKKWTGIVKI